MPAAPIISCVIPVFNGKADLRRAVDSVLAQGPAVQLVLVDDGSNDGSRDLVLETARGDPRVLAILVPESRGQGNARNIGVAAASAPYVTFLDQDDEHIPGWYDYASELLDTNPEYAAIRGEVELKDLPEGLQVAPGDPRLPAITNSVMWNVVTRKVVYQAVGGCPAARHYGEDVAFVTALGKHFPVMSTDYPATAHYVRPGGSTAHFLKRTRVAGAGFEFLETHAVETDGTLQKALLDYQSRSDRSMSELRTLLGLKR
jgi:glycosyltransferase involved in cell wall biosynthesis